MLFPMPFVDENIFLSLEYFRPLMFEFIPDFGEYRLAFGFKSTLSLLKEIYETLLKDAAKGRC